MRDIYLEAIRKLFSNVVPISSSILAVMKYMATAWSKSVQHKMNITDLDYSRTGFYASLIVLAVPSVSTMPGVRTLNHPTFLQGREAFRTLWARLHFEAPPRTMPGHPRVEVVMMILHVGKNGLQARKIVRRDVAEQVRGRHAIIEACTGHEDGHQHPQRLDQEMPLTPFDVLAAILPTLGAPDLGGLDRLAIDARGTGGGLAPRCHTNSFAQGLDHLGPCPIVAPLGKGVIDGAFGESIVRQHIPLAAAPVEREQRIEDFPHVHLARAPSSFPLLGRWDHRSHHRPLLVREIRRILLSMKNFINHSRALLC